MRPTHLAVFGVLLMGADDCSGSAQPAGSRGPVARSAHERIDERRRMVDTQIAHPRDGRDPVSDPLVIDAMLAVPRHAFVPAPVGDQAYGDTPLPIGHGQTISQPYIVALMTEHLRLPPAGKVLEVGSGSGYQAAVLAHLTPNVFTIEIVEELGQDGAAAPQGPGLCQRPGPARRRPSRMARAGAVRRHHRHLRAGRAPAAAVEPAQARRPHRHPDRARGSCSAAGGRVEDGGRRATHRDDHRRPLRADGARTVVLA